VTLELQEYGFSSFG